MGENRQDIAPKSRRNRGRTRGQPRAARRLEDDLRRFRLAQEVVPELIDTAESFLTWVPRLAQRRVPDRIGFMSNLASDVLAWTALAAPREETRLTVRCFATCCLLDATAHRIGWQALALSGTAAEVSTYIREVASLMTELPSEGEDPESPKGQPDSLLDDVRAFVGRLRERHATSADGQEMSRRLLNCVIAIDPDLAESGAVGNLTALGAVALMERALPAHDPEDEVRLAAILEAVANELPGLVEHAVTHLDDENEEELEDRGDPMAWDEGDLEEDDEDDIPLDEALTTLDVHLRMTEEASVGAEVALQAASLLLVRALQELTTVTPTLEPVMRAIAAGNALSSTDGADLEIPAEGGDALAWVYSRAAALMDAGLPAPAPASEAVDGPFAELDEVVGAMLHAAEQESVEGLPGALALIGGAAVALRAGIRLGHEDADAQRQMAAALGVLDPLAMADLPEVRPEAAATLRELARSAAELTRARHALPLP